MFNEKRRRKMEFNDEKSIDLYNEKILEK